MAFWNLPVGWSYGAAASGIRGDEAARLDVALVVSDREATAAGMFTTNRVQAAPVHLCRDLIKQRGGRLFGKR